MTLTGSLVLPFPSIGLLGGSAAGAAALRSYGIQIDGFGGQFEELVARLDDAAEPDAQVRAAAVRTLAGLAACALGWLSVRAAGERSAVVLTLGAQNLVARFDGPTVEWMLHDTDELWNYLKSSVAAEPVVVTAFAGDVPLASIRIRADEADVAGAPDVIEALSSAAASGGEELVAALLDVLNAPPGSKADSRGPASSA